MYLIAIIISTPQTNEYKMQRPGASFKLLDDYEAVIGVSLLPWQRTRRRRGARIPEPRRQCLLCRCVFSVFFCKRNASSDVAVNLGVFAVNVPTCTHGTVAFVGTAAGFGDVSTWDSSVGVCWCVLSTFCHLSLGGHIKSLNLCFEGLCLHLELPSKTFCRAPTLPNMFNRLFA